MVLPSPRLVALAGTFLALAGCDQVLAPAAPTADPPAAPGPSTAGTPAAPPRPGLTRAGAQTVTLELRNGTDLPVSGLSVVRDGVAGPNLLPAGTAIPPGGSWALPVATGRYLLRAELQPPSVFAQPRAVLRHVVVPLFPPEPPPRLAVTLR